MTTVESRLDALLPEYDLVEHHQRIIGASPFEVYEAFKALKLRELDLGFTALADVPEREIVVGEIGRFWRPGGRIVRVTSPQAFVAFDEPGFVKAAVTFLNSARGGATVAETETRVLATDASARRSFRRYWLLIRPFSGLIRRVWLRAVARRVERGPSISGARVARRVERGPSISGARVARRAMIEG